MISRPSHLGCAASQPGLRPSQTICAESGPESRVGPHIIARRYSYGSAYIFGAVCPARDEGAALVLPRADTEAMQLHLQEISRMVAPGAHGIVVMDKGQIVESGSPDELLAFASRE